MTPDRPPWQELSPEISEAEAAAATTGIVGPVAVTGATGFVGSHLLDVLRGASVSVRVLVRRPDRIGNFSGAVEVVVGDLDDGAALRRLVDGTATVIHLAGLVRAGRAADFDRTNRVGTQSVVAALRARAPGARLIHVSSLAAAGPSRNPAGRAPTDPPAPISAYGRSKLAAENAVEAWGGRWAIVRPPAVYGPRDRDVLQFFRLIHRGLVPVPSGARWVSLAHVSDVVRAILAVARGRGDHRVLHAGDPHTRTITELLATLAGAGGRKARIIPVPSLVVRAGGLAGDVLHRLGARSVALTSDKARELLARHWTAEVRESLVELGISGSVPLEIGAAATWTWYEAQGWVPHATIRRRGPEV
jgi:nucleoside-diphosphate-sugar epimerase